MDRSGPGKGIGHFAFCVCSAMNPSLSPEIERLHTCTDIHFALKRTSVNLEHQAAVLMKSIAHFCHLPVSIRPPGSPRRPPIALCDPLFIIPVLSLSWRAGCALSQLPGRALGLSILLPAPHPSNSLIGLCLSPLLSLGNN